MFGMEYNDKHLESSCVCHDKIQEEIFHLIHCPIDFAGQDVYEVINVLNDKKEESLHCSTDTGILDLLICVQSSITYFLREDSLAIEERISLLQTVYFDVLKDIPAEMYLEDICDSHLPSCSLSYETSKAVLGIMISLSSSSILAPFVGSFDFYVQSIESGHFTYSEFLAIASLHNIVAFMSEISQLNFPFVLLIKSRW